MEKMILARSEKIEKTAFTVDKKQRLSWINAAFSVHSVDQNNNRDISLHNFQIHMVMALIWAVNFSGPLTFYNPTTVHKVVRLWLSRSFISKLFVYIKVIRIRKSFVYEKVVRLHQTRSFIAKLFVYFCNNMIYSGLGNLTHN